MTAEEYYSGIGRLDLRPSGVPEVFQCSKDGECYSVPDPVPMTPQQRAATFKKIKAKRGF